VVAHGGTCTWETSSNLLASAVACAAVTLGGTNAPERSKVTLTGIRGAYKFQKASAATCQSRQPADIQEMLQFWQYKMLPEYTAVDAKRSDDISNAQTPPLKMKGDHATE
jgi:hypothetical protein